MASSAFQKSTIVRLIRGLYGACEVVAPGLGAKLAARMWFTLPQPPRTPPPPEGGEPFEVESLRAKVRGRYWGDGPVVYLMHGWGGLGAQLAPYVDPLVRRGYRVVMFDAPAHGASDPGPSGPRSSHGVEFGKALDAVAARFGPAHAVIAHSMGAVPVLLTLKYGWLSTERLVFLAPMSRFSTQFDAFARLLGLGPRIRRRVEAITEQRVGIPVAGFDLLPLAEEAGPIPTLMVHDRGDRQTSYLESAALAAALPAAELVSTDGLGHRRLLRDRSVVESVVAFVVDGNAAEAVA
jgi:pimeloyl-ACP methyl ester carboxylesterase